MTAGPVRGGAPAPPVAPAQAGASAEEAKLRKTAQQLEGLFVEQLFKAMRETVPQGEGVVSGGSGEDMFTTLMDQHLAADTPTQWAHGLAAAAYRQLQHALPTTGQPADSKSVTPASVAALRTPAGSDVAPR